MNVKELTEKLSTMPQDWYVFVSVEDADGGEPVTGEPYHIGLDKGNGSGVWITAHW